MNNKNISTEKLISFIRTLKFQRKRGYEFYNERTKEFYTANQFAEHIAKEYEKQHSNEALDLDKLFQFADDSELVPIVEVLNRLYKLLRQNYSKVF